MINRFFILFYFIYIFLVTKPVYSLDQEIQSIVNEIDTAKDNFNSLEVSEIVEATKIDNAFNEIDKVTDFVKEALSKNNEQEAIKALEFIEKSLSGAASLTPQLFSSDMSNADFKSFGDDNMSVVNEITANLNISKDKKNEELISNLIDLNEAGLNAFDVVENLSELGVNTVDIKIAIEKKKEMATWTKEEWANSWKGDVLTDDGQQIISDNEINSNISTLEQKLQANNLEILDKKNSLNLLQTKIDPLSDQITDLKTQKTALLAKYNDEILKQSSTILSDDEINKSKELADQFNSELSDLTSQIKTVEQNSNLLNQQIQGLNLELANEISTKSQLEQNINNLNSQLRANQNLLTKKELELDQLKNTDLNTKVISLNEQLQYASRERDFIESNFEKSIDLEVDALARYHSALGDVDSKDFDKQIDFSMREVGVIIDADPRKHRAFEIEKYATYAGFSEDYIQKSIQAVNSDDWARQKEIYKEVAKKLSKNPEWVVDVPSNAELNVMIEEDKAIQAAALASMEVEAINSSWNSKINEQVKEFQPLAGLNTTWIKYSSLQSNTAETDLVAKELDKILNSDVELKNLTATLEEKQKQLIDIQEFQRLKTEEINNAIKPLQEQVSSAYAELNDIQQTYIQKSIEKTAYINSIGGYASLYRDKGNPNYSDWVRNIGNFDQELGDIRSNSQKIQTEALNISNEIYKIQTDNGTSQTDINNWINLQQEVGNLSLQQISKVGAATEQARSNIIAKVEEATAKYNEIISQENPELKAVEEKVIKILKGVPTFADDAENLAGLDPATLRAKLIDITTGTNNETAALNAARDAVAKIGKDPVGNLTGPLWEMTNIKAAAIVRSKKYDYVDDYAYITATYGDPLSLNSSQREEIESELKNLLGKDNIKLKTLNTKVSELSNELNLTKEQSQNLTMEISKLERELSSLKNSENEIQAQISNLSNQFNSKESLIVEKTQNLASLQEQLNPISNRMNDLEGQRAELNAKLNDQLNTIANQIESQGQGTEKANALKTQFENQIAELDNQLKDYENQTVEINNQLTSLTTELTSLETETPDISKKITKLNEELDNIIEIKADLAMSQAIKSDIELNKKITSAVRKLQNKSVVQLQGTELVKIVSNEILEENVNNLAENRAEIDTKNLIVPEGVVSLENTLSVDNLSKNIDTKTIEIGKISISENALDKINNSSVASSLERIKTAQAELNKTSLSSSISSSIGETNQSDIGTETISKSLDNVAKATETAATQSSISTSNVEEAIKATQAKVSAKAESVAANEALAAAQAAAESSPDSSAAQEAVEQAQAASEAANVAVKAAEKAAHETHQAVSEASVAAQAAAEAAQAAAAQAAQEAAQAAAEAAAQAAADAAQAAAAEAAKAAAEAAAQAAQDAANAARSAAIDARVSELQSAMESWKNDPGMTQEKKDYWINDATNEINELNKEKSGL